MNKIPILLTGLLLFALCSSSGWAISLNNQSVVAEGKSVTLKVPKGMRLELVASITDPAPRFIAKGPDGELILGSKGPALYRLKNPYRTVETLVTLHGFLHSAAYRQGRLYAAETAAVWSAPYAGAASMLSASNFTREAILPSLTGGHASRTIVRGPDNRLYVGIGISGNCSDEYLHNSYPFERRRGGVFVLQNGNLSPYSSGLRNPIGLAFHPDTGTLYATNAGPDNLGYDLPPEVIAPLSYNSFHGMPWFQYYSGAFRSGECAQSAPPRPASQATRPVALLSARSTPEGISFLRGSNLGKEFDSSAAVAVHGSWATRPGMGQESRRKPKLSLVVFRGASLIGVEDLVTGFQRSDGSRFARPCGVAVGDDGNLYFTSDGGDVTGLFRLVPAGPSVSSAINLLLGDN